MLIDIGKNLVNLSMTKGWSFSCDRKHCLIRLKTKIPAAPKQKQMIQIYHQLCEISLIQQILPKGCGFGKTMDII